VDKGGFVDRSERSSNLKEESTFYYLFSDEGGLVGGGEVEGKSCRRKCWRSRRSWRWKGWRRGKRRRSCRSSGWRRRRSWRRKFRRRGSWRRKRWRRRCWRRMRGWRKRG